VDRGSRNASYGRILSVSNKLPPSIAEKVLAMPEYGQGAHKVRVTLRNGDNYADVIAWADEVVKVGERTEIPFDAAEIIDVEREL
jgi:hypothetical protein